MDKLKCFNVADYVIVYHPSAGLKEVQFKYTDYRKQVLYRCAASKKIVAFL